MKLQRETFLNKHLSTLLDLTSDAIIVCTLQGEILFWNKTASTLYGFSEQEASRHTKCELLHMQYALPWDEIVSQLQRQGRWQGEVTCTTSDGQTRVVMSCQTLITEEDGSQCILETNSDLTERKTLENLLRAEHEEIRRESEERFMALADTIRMFIWIVDKEGGVTYANKYTLDYMSLTDPSEFTGNAWEKLTDPRDLQRIHDVHARAIQTHQPYTLEARFLDQQKKNAVYEYFLVQAVPRFLANGEFIGVVGTAVNINDLKQTQQELATQTAFLRNVIESTPDLIVMKDRQGKYLLANHATAEMLAKPIEEVIGHDDRDLFPPEIARTLMETDQRVMTTENSEIIEEILPASNGERIYLTSKGPLRTIDNEVTGIVVVARDITVRKELERQKDDFMGVVSHELKTPVTSLKAFAQILHKRFVKAGDDRSAEVLLKMDVQINKLTTLITDLLDVTKLEAGKFQYTETYFSFAQLVQEIVEETQRTSTHHQILLETSSEQMIYGDRERLGQVLINLLTNAIKYSLNTENILVQTRSDGKNVTVRVQDFGIGIPEDKKAHLFERFYRVSGHTLDTIPGLGLGLYISAEIIKRHEGTIWIESSPTQKGSTFCFTLPIKHNSTDLT